MTDQEQCEKIAELGAEIKSHQRQLDSHENRISKLEDVNSIIAELSTTVKNQGKNIDKLTDGFDKMIQNNQGVYDALAEVKKKTEEEAEIKLIKSFKKLPKWAKIIITIGIVATIGVSFNSIVELILSFVK